MILSIDQSTNISGVAVLDSKKQLLYYDIIDISDLPKQTDQDQTEKRFQFLQQLKLIIWKYKIKQIITEGIYFHSNQDTYCKLSKMQGCIQDYSRSFDILCFSFSNAGEWRKILSIKAKAREEYKQETKNYVLLHHNIKDDVEKMIFDKYHTSKHHCFDDLSKDTKNIQFDVYDAIAQCEAYFLKIEQLK
jgi:Holliday junction resolvasome RuvABC endonuclease subunit